MKEVRGLYKCDICGGIFSEYIISTHTEDCQMRYDKKIAAVSEYRKKYIERLEEARKIAIESRAIRLLVNHGHKTEAKILCREYAGFLWDCGTSSGWEEVYSEMLKAVEEDLKIFYR